MTTTKNNMLIEQMQEHIEACNETQRSYPRLISEDKIGFEKSVSNFLSTVKIAINGIKPLYEKLGLDGEFNDQIFHSMYKSSSYVSDKYAEKADRIAELIGVNSGFTNKAMINYNNPLVHDIKSRMSNLSQNLNSAWSRSNAPLNPHDVINVNGDLRLNDEAYSAHLEAYRFYVNDEREEKIKTAVDRFAAEYSFFVDELKRFGYGPYVGTVHGTYLSNLFNETAELKLIPMENIVQFLAKFSK